MVSTILAILVERDEERDDGRTDWLTKAAPALVRQKHPIRKTDLQRLCLLFVCSFRKVLLSLCKEAYRSR
jgi:hypothetical protein